MRVCPSTRLPARRCSFASATAAASIPGATDFHSNAPFLTGEGARWLVDHEVKAVGYDFPEEEIIRKDEWDGKDAIVHHTLLGNDIYNIAYVVNLSRISTPFVRLIATPPLGEEDVVDSWASAGCAKARPCTDRRPG